MTARVEVLGNTARIVDEAGNDLEVIGDVRQPGVAFLAHAMVELARVPGAPVPPHCPLCGAMAGEPCRNVASGVERAPHISRGSLP